MKLIIIAILIQFFAPGLFAQHSVINSKWRGHIESPQSLDIIFDFRKDTVIVNSAEGAELEVMSYSQNKDTVRLRKLNGTSPCDYSAEGTYHIQWLDSGEKLVFHAIKDDCDDRAKAITSATAYFRVKD